MKRTKKYGAWLIGGGLIGGSFIGGGLVMIYYLMKKPDQTSPAQPALPSSTYVPWW